MSWSPSDPQDCSTFTIGEDGVVVHGLRVVGRGHNLYDRRKGDSIPFSSYG